MRLLDLYCGAGGAAKGYYNAGFTEIVGVDIKVQTHYPYNFVLEDALVYVEKYGKQFDAIHASPPCQSYSRTVGRSNGAPKLIPITRILLRDTGKPYVIENVEGAPLYRGITLCGAMFGLKVIRHRTFECNIPLHSPKHVDHPTEFFTVVGHERGRLREWRNAMGINWMSRVELTQAIPPAYTEYIGKQILKVLK